MGDRIIYKSCPLCGGSFTHLHSADCSVHPLFDNRLNSKMHWNKCNSCQHIFTEGYFTDEANKILFSKTHPDQQAGANIEASRFISAKIIDKVVRFKNAGIWLDIGFGNGSLLFTAKEYGFEVMGIDLREDSVNIMKSLGYNAFKSDFLKFCPNEKLSVISMADVLEHTPHPLEYLKKANQLLGKEGVLVASMPNTECVVWQAMDNSNSNPYWFEIEHYHNFSRSILYSILKTNGFEPVQYSVSERYRACMEVIAIKRNDLS